METCLKSYKRKKIIVYRLLFSKKNRMKMAKYHNFQKFVAKKHCFGTKWESIIFYVLELAKIEF